MNIQDLDSEQRKVIVRVVTEIDHTIQDITHIYEDAMGLVVCFTSEEWYIFQTREDAEQAVYAYWENMAQDDLKEFAFIIGDKRLIQWGMGQSDEYGISSAHEFFQKCADYCEETLASYDNVEHEIDGIYYYRRS